MPNFESGSVYIVSNCKITNFFAISEMIDD